jgi:uncharacterized protein YqgC (DUF456 family)
MKVALTAACLLIMVAGLAGTVLPALPGVPLIYLGYLLYGLFTSWHAYGLGTMLFWGAIVALTLLVDYYASVLGARRFGSSIFGVWGSFVGAIVGLLVFGLAGLIIGTFAGAVLGELVAGRSMRDALKAGKGSLIGFLAGSLCKAMVGLIMIGTFLWLLWGRP